MYPGRGMLGQSLASDHVPMFHRATARYVSSQHRAGNGIAGGWSIVGYGHRQMEVFRSLDTKPSDWKWDGTFQKIENDGLNDGFGTCEICGCNRLKWHFTLISSQETGRKILFVGSECVTTFSEAEQLEFEEIIRRTRRLSSKIEALAKQADISQNDATKIFFHFEKQMEKSNGKWGIWTFSGFLYNVIHQPPKLCFYEINSITAEKLLAEYYAPYDPLYLKRLKRKIKRQREANLLDIEKELLQ